MEIFQDGELEEALRKNDGLQAHNLSTWWRLFCTSYEELIQSITNPVRASYSLVDLGDTTFTIHNSKANPAESFEVVREDLQLKNVRNEVLECSFWQRKPSSSVPVVPHWRASVHSYRRASVDSVDSMGDGNRWSTVSDPTMPMGELLTLSPAAYQAATAPPCIVYLHEMSSSRKECVYLRKKILAAGFSLFALDLSGSGMSEGDRVSFGYFEQDDLRAVMDYLYATGRASCIGIWGRGIGGAATLLHLRQARGFQYKSLLLTKKDAKKLQVVEDKATGQLLCVRPSSLRLPFRFTRTDVQNGDFVLLSIGNVAVKGLSVEQCMQLIKRNDDARLRIAGYVKAEQDGGDKFVFGLTMDCTFGDMEQVISDMLIEISQSAQRRNLVFPIAMVSAAAKIISRSIRKTGGFNVRDIKLLGDVPQFQWPCMFVRASKKDFITPAHTEALCEHYGGPKELIQFMGVHDENRPSDVVDKVVAHFLNAMHNQTADLGPMGLSIFDNLSPR
uniref:Serine aminopeptidase S33 domain-containing protein n=1 Tax=Globisporangium ultimum (strain ATCC 200006 / CBS 805.95 / DAOM BR144) TaxID=431595 RepID=K3X2B3_GLOUD